ncbi:irregular chiasm C-roughest protein-like isoform X2 [Macrobrachium nipponense]|uniref:irregular chiasm C-roughest protein-like isoform X2 n=1 Tax=Macrobrachium nipponense TaxID=159736 RepID=UPI0030C8957E
MLPLEESTSDHFLRLELLSPFSLMKMSLIHPAAATTSRWKVFFSLGCFCMLFHVARGEQRFVQEPEDVTVKHGEAITLPCRVADRKGTVQWTKDGFGLGTDEELHGFSRYTMVVNEDEGIFNLHIQPVLIEDDAQYQCQVGGAAGERHLKSTTAKVTVHFPPTDSEDQVHLDKASPMLATAGSPVRITCEAGMSTPASEIKWFLNGEESFAKKSVNTTKEKQPRSILVAVRSRLDIVPSRVHHEANITCQVLHPALKEPISRSLIMTVKYPPEVKIQVDSAKIKENDDVRFTCQAEGNPPALRYRWEVNDIGVVGDHKTEYIIHKIQRDSNKAKVACIVANSIGSTKAEHTISVEYSPRFNKEPVDVDADEDQKVTLSCDVEGNPPAQIVWLHNNQNKVIKVGATYQLTVTPETVGTYECRATVTGFPEEKRTMDVFMRGPPVVTPVEEQFGLEGDTVSVECDIQSMPRPAAVVWKRERYTIDPNQSRYNVLQENTKAGIKSILIIQEAMPEDFGLYNCTAKNGYGSHTHEIMLKRQQSLPLVTTLVAIIGGIIFLIVVVVVIVLFKKKGKGYKDSGIEKHSMRSSDRSSTHDSVLKVETRTATGSDISPSEDDDYSSHDEWETTDTATSNARRHDHLRYSAGEFVDPLFPPKEGVNNNSGGYVQYTDYSRDYNPPPPLSYNRNSLYSGAAPQFTNVDPRYSAAYGNPYLRVPSNSRSTQNLYGSSGGLASQGPPVSGPLPGSNGGLTLAGGVPLYAAGAQNLNNNLNNVNNNSAGYGQIGNARNNLRGSANMNNQYIMVPQGDSRHGVQGTHI